MLLNILFALFLLIRIIFGLILFNPIWFVYFGTDAKKHIFDGEPTTTTTSKPQIMITISSKIPMSKVPKPIEGNILEGLGIMKWQDKYCGSYRNFSNKEDPYFLVRPRSAGGRSTRYGEFPSAALVHANASKCSAAIISNRHFLTTGHCINGSDVPTIKLFVGHTNYQYRQVYYVEKYCKHKNHAWQGQVQVFDVSVVKTDRDIEFRPDVQPACLPREQLYPDDIVYLATLGYEPDPNSDSNLITGEYAKALPMHSTVCSDGGGHPTISCVFPFDRGHTCRADSGSPGIVFRHGRQEVVGIVTFGPIRKCEARTQYPVGLTDLFWMRDDVVKLVEECS